MSEYRKYAVIGGRDFDDWELLSNTLNIYIIKPKNFKTTKVIVVHGGASGADSMADSWCQKHGIHTFMCQSLWHYYSHAGGPIRNEVMLACMRPHMLIAFPGGKGTESCIRLAKKFGIPIIYAHHGG